MHWPGKAALIVDDNGTNRRIYATQLRHWGMETVSVETAHEALECLRQRTFDLALFDFEMPEMNGIELAQRVAGLGLAPGLRIILCSSSGVTRKELHAGPERAAVSCVPDQADPVGLPAGSDRPSVERRRRAAVADARRPISTRRWPGSIRCASCWPKTTWSTRRSASRC